MKTKRLILTAIIAASVGYVAGVNATAVTSALYVSRVTGTSFYQVLDPLHRRWLHNAVEASIVPADTSDDNEEGE